MKATANIILVMADQLTASLTGAYGHGVVKTPSLDRLRSEGVRFDSAYTNCPLCAPARATLFSGKAASKTRSYDNASSFPCDTPTFAHYLRDRGYETAASGKMHFVGPDQLHGLERRLTTDIYPSNFVWTPDWNHDRTRGIENQKGVHGSEAGVCTWSEQLDYDEKAHLEALEFLRSHRQDSHNQNPFFLFVSYTHPHLPYLITRKYWDIYEECEIDLPLLPEPVSADSTEMDLWLTDYEGLPEGDRKNHETIRSMRRAYYGMVSYVDEKVGQLLECVEAMGFRDNTAIIFLSDHGDMLGERGLVEKRVFYESSARIPLICSYPGHWKPGLRVDVPVSLVDIFPTLVELAGGTPPEGLDGLSLFPLLEGESRGEFDRAVLSEYFAEGVLSPCFMLRHANYKYIEVYNGRSQLFDLVADPLETTNLLSRKEYRDQREFFKQMISMRVDSASIARDVERSQRDRIMMRRAMEKGLATHWDHKPYFDETLRHTRS